MMLPTHMHCLCIVACGQQVLVTTDIKKGISVIEGIMAMGRMKHTGGLLVYMHVKEAKEARMVFFL